MIVARATHHELRAVAVEEGMRTMQEQAFGLVVDGMTTVEDVLRSVYAPGANSVEEEQKELPAGKRALPQAPGAIPPAAAELVSNGAASLYEATSQGTVSSIPGSEPINAEAN